MTLQEYHNKYILFLLSNPQALGLEVVCSNTEGYTCLVNNPPVLGFNEGGDFIPVTKFKEYDIPLEKINAVCIN